MKRCLSRPCSPLAVAAVLAAGLVGCGSGSDEGSGSPTAQPQAAPSGSAPDTVDIHDFAFAPDALTVKPGATVTWKFDDSTDHTVVADDNSFASKAMGSGQIYEHTFPAAGSLAYHCSIHPFMKGTVTVK
jgi:plastocyanin